MKKKLNTNSRKNKWMIGGMIAAAFLIGGLVFAGSQVKAQVVDFVPDRILDLFDRFVELERADAVGETIIEEQSFGAVSSPVLPSPSWTFGGVRHEAGFDGSLTQASTTVCAFKSPKATSTLVSANVVIEVSSTTEVFYEWSKSVAQADTPTQEGTPNASTTVISTYAVAADATATIFASTSRADVLPESIQFDARIASTTAGIPDESTNDWLLLRASMPTAAAGAGTISPTGHCQVEWLIL